MAARKLSRKPKKLKSAATKLFSLNEYALALPGKILIAAILLIAAVFRFTALDLKAPHFDEGINGHFVNTIWSSGFYKYDPTNFHGPLYFYVLQFADLIFGPTIAGFRLVNGVIALAALYLVARHQRFFGRGALWAAFILAVSPGFVFYSRYAIHECLFVVAELLFSYGLLAFINVTPASADARKIAVNYMIAGFFIAMTLKETFVVVFGVWAIAVGCLYLSLRIRPIPHANEITAPVDRGEAMGSVVLGVLFVLALFSGFFAHLGGIVDMLKALAVWTKTGTGATGHEKPFEYWIKLIFTYEWPVTIGFVAMPFYFLAKDPRVRVLAFAGTGTWLAHSIIPYKTPWLILNFLWIFAIFTGLVVCQAFDKSLPWMRATLDRDTGHRAGLAARISPQISKNIAIVLLVVTLGASIKKSLELNFVNAMNASEPYVYVQSTAEFKRVIDLVQKAVHDRPENLNMTLKVLNKDTWPMPWLLARFTHLEWGRADTADLRTGDVILFDKDDLAKVDAKLNGKYFVLPFQIRDAYQGGFAYLAHSKFAALMPLDAPTVERTETKR